MRDRRERALRVPLGWDLRGDEQAQFLLQHWKTIDSIGARKRAPLILTVTRLRVQWLDGQTWRVAKRKR